VVLSMVKKDELARLGPEFATFYQFLVDQGVIPHDYQNIFHYPHFFGGEERYLSLKH